VVQAQFCLDSPLHNPCFNASNQFVDIISNPPNDVIVGPSGSVSQPYNPGSNMGLGSFNIAPGAARGSSVSGNILPTYNTFDADPNGGGNQIGFNDAISAAASVTAVPEPAALGLAGFALAGLGALRLRRR
jgi:PEP-CTERM motif